MYYYTCVCDQPYCLNQNSTKNHARPPLFWLVPRRAPYTWWYLIPFGNDYDMWSETEVR